MSEGMIAWAKRMTQFMPGRPRSAGRSAGARGRSMGTGRTIRPSSKRPSFISCVESGVANYEDCWIAARRCNNLHASATSKADGSTGTGWSATAGAAPGGNTMRAIVLGIFLAALLAVAAPPAGRAQAPLLLIRGATIIDGVADAPLRDR